MGLSKKERIPTTSIVIACPNCNSRQFFVSELDIEGSPFSSQPEILGISDCRTCGEDSPVVLSQEILHLMRVHVGNALRCKKFPEHEIKTILSAI